MSQDDLNAVLKAGTYLVAHSKDRAHNELKSVLLSRLREYHNCIGTSIPSEADTFALERVQRLTAQASLEVLEKCQAILAVEDEEREEPKIGSRDLSELRTLLSVVFNWGTVPLLSRLISSWPDSADRSSREVIDLTDMPENFQMLSDLTSRLLGLLYPASSPTKLPNTHITTSILQYHLSELLRPIIALGWLPSALATGDLHPMLTLRPIVGRLLAVLPPSQSIAALGSVMAFRPTAKHVLKVCSILLTQQLLRPEGVKGLCTAVFQEEDGSGEAASFEKLERVSRILSSIPANMKPEEYFKAIIPRIIALLGADTPESFKRAGAFTLARLLESSTATTSQSHATPFILDLLHKPFLEDPSQNENSSVLAVDEALDRIIVLLANTDPSPTLIPVLLAPLVPPLYSLLDHLDHVRTSDPSLKDAVKGLIGTWSKIASPTKAVEKLWSLLSTSRMYWQVTLEGSIRKLAQAEQGPRLSLYTPEDLTKAEDAGELDLASNMLDLYPDPAHFASIIKGIGQQDITSQFFVRLLEAYRDVRNDEDPQKSIMYLQLIFQLQSQSSEGSDSVNVLKRPEHILTFIKHALETAGSAKPNSASSDLPSHIADMHLHDVQDDGEVSDGDSDDDMLDSERFTADDEMTETSINLLLSILEANEDMSARNSPVLNDIFLLLEPMASEGPDAIQTLAREARLVMTARLASNSTTASSRARSIDEEDVQQTYQKALKLLQDPILPVRAHGLLLLRQLVAPQSKSAKMIEPAFVPSILAIFRQTIQDEDSYIFLNAVQGLAAMADSLGREVLRGLIQDYTKGFDGPGLTKKDIDVRLRVGEALAIVIKRCGSALSSYSDIFIPPLLLTARSSHVPTVLRTSAISLLSECASTQPISLIRYLENLSEGMVDLLQVESPKSHTTEEEDMNEDPISKSSKLPPLRRAALHFLQVLIKESTLLLYESPEQDALLSEAFLRRARITLGYLASTDPDQVVRVMAREAEEAARQLQSGV